MNLIISNQTISQHNGFFSLNDLHKSAGGEDKYRPTFFMRNQQTQDLIAEIESEGKIAYDTVKGGDIKTVRQGTYACRELVYAYAMWISAKFHLMVIRAFDALNTGAIPVLDPYHTKTDRATAAQLQGIKDKVHRLSFCFRKTGSASNEMYNLLRVKLSLRNIADISENQIPQAHAILDGIAPHCEAYCDYRREIDEYA
ncbi:hypothetical protein B0181_11865, partial [Moraxella caviae]